MMKIGSLKYTMWEIGSDKIDFEFGIEKVNYFIITIKVIEVGKLFIELIKLH